MSTHAYLGIGPCGCARAIVIDEPDHPIDTAATVAEFIRSGLTIERVTDAEGRRRILIDCDDCRARDAERRLRQKELFA